MKRRSLPVQLDLRLLGWCLPYAMIWSAAWAGVASLGRVAQCTGFCALYVGSVAYTTVAVAVALTAVVAAAELVLLSR